MTQPQKNPRCLVDRIPLDTHARCGDWPHIGCSILFGPGHYEDEPAGRHMGKPICADCLDYYRKRGMRHRLAQLVV